MFQDGGISQYFVDYTPFAFQQQTEKSSSSSSNKQNEVGIKDLLGLIKELKGLPIDSAVITERINDMYTNLSLYNNGQIDTSDLVNTYLSVLRDIRTAEFNKQEYEDAKKETVSNESYNEAAFDQYGRMWIQDTESGEISRVTPEEYISIGDKESYQVLTNSNLLYLRANSPDFAFRNEILSVVHNGTSIKEITEQLQKVANNIGTTTLKEEGYSERTAQNIIEGMATLEKGLQAGMTIQGLYKQGKITKDQTQQAQAALSYLWKTLPANARGLLTLKGGSTEGALNLINTLISSSLSPEIDYTQDLINDPKKNSKSGKTNEDGEDAKGSPLDPVKGFALGMGDQTIISINPGTSIQSTHIARKSIVTDANGNPLGQYSTLKDVSNGAFAATLDFNNATFGGERIVSYNRAFLENANIYRMDLPIDVNYKNKTGIIRPDLVLAKKLEALDAAIKRGEVDPNNIEQVNSKCIELDLPEQYSGIDLNGNPQLNTVEWASFGVLDAIVDENAFEDADKINKNLVKEISDKRRESFKEYMKTADKNYSVSEDFKFIINFGGGDDVYEGKIFIPATSDPIAASYGGNYYKLPQYNAIQVAQMYADDQARQKYVNPGNISNYK